MSEITARFTLTGADYEVYLRHYYGQTKRGRRQMRRMYFIGMIAYVWFMVLEYDHPRFGIANPGAYAAYATVTALLVGGALWFLLHRLLPLFAQSAVRRSALRDMFTETEITIGDSGLAIQTQKGRGRLAWGHVTELGENADYLFLHTGGLNAFILPRRGFGSAEESEAAAERIRQMLASR